MNIGVLALQGAFREHRRLLEQLGASVREVRLPTDLQGLSGLIIPGGESTTMGKLMLDYGLREPLRAFAAQGHAVWGTCAGAILLARDIRGVPPQFGTQPSLDLLDMTVRRNAFGRQVDSFEESLQIEGLESSFPAVFIRAPVIESVGARVNVLARHQGQIVLVRQGALLASSFHPELTHDTRLHELFLKVARAPLLTPSR
ncbi:pyridoxal 5'-phosphate synthase glutaminase subunit PdxT [Deinococcus peraridilitoris]|uniref:Pyridoxal 5'-phosphate synthase subunit PdxT n=1 Tax=Deinococcus peraridilitoris (strain DSM 19664 / LMG 22246 / CIP 109416 / KR-200) TaxID=937777 RepID=L0A7V2_DEIPD|nr:pyridoxal 5'-phosphate synthase glutaminase subunit PdxT [Deinococcus peraridilitoris]AFZ69110.1 pyridoxal 5'-phosphate synthase, glutaminase subunit Pdx2 [Deinococcus peraridilitoris DSM 19664]